MNSRQIKALKEEIESVVESGAELRQVWQDAGLPVARLNVSGPLSSQIHAALDLARRLGHSPTLRFLTEIITRYPEADLPALQRVLEADRLASARSAQTAQPPVLFKEARTWILILLAGMGLASFWLIHSARPHTESSPPLDLAVVHLSGGPFIMGSSEDEIEAAYQRCRHQHGPVCSRALFERELPPRSITLSPFGITSREITWGDLSMWIPEDKALTTQPVEDGSTWVLSDLQPILRLDRTSGLRPSGPSIALVPGHEAHPVTSITWHGARLFCQHLGGDLPTEAQWAFAARGAKGRDYPWGSAPPKCREVVAARGVGGVCESMGAGPKSVGTHSQDRSPEGVWDLGGNVMEWVRDSYEPFGDILCAHPCVDPLNTSGDTKSIRGGSWQTSFELLRTGIRSHAPPQTYDPLLGFRCVL